jgi:lipoate---protein ligase
MHLNLLSTKNLFIHSQLQYEEALLRLEEGNWCWINQGSAKAVVLGISQKIEEELCYVPKEIPIIRRFSGGGSVLVNENTLFVSFIISKKELSCSTSEEVHRWMATFYKTALQLSTFDLKENDYVIEDRKCAGNAQYLQKNRWLHHTSFLWDYEPQEMNLLAHPKKAPAYRKNRPHNEFLTPLKHHFSSMEDLVLRIRKNLTSYFDVEEKKIEEVEKISLLPHRKNTSLL